MTAVAAPVPTVGERLARLELDEAWLVDPGTGREGPGSLVVEDGVVSSVRWSASDAGARPRLVVVPGFIDLHAHLREPGGEDGESFETGLAAAAHGGFALVCAMADTKPAVDRPEIVQRVRAAAASARVPVAMRPYGSLTVGREGKGLAPLSSMAAAGVVGFSDDPSPVVDAALLRAALTEAGTLGLPVVLSADEPSLRANAEANEGLPATILGLHGSPPAAEVTAVARAIAVLRQVSAEAPADVRPHLHLAHLSTAEVLDPIRAARAEGLRVTCDVAPHHLALHDGWLGGDRRFAWEAAGSPWAGRRDGGDDAAAPYDPSTRVDPPLRSPSDALALLAAVADGTIDAIATDHSPARAVDKEVPFGDALPGMSSAETALGLVLEAVGAGRLSLPRAVRALTLGPWRVIGGEALGVPEPGLREGIEASLVILDRAATWTVERGSWRSRSFHTPLRGRALPGVVRLTVAAGRVAHAASGDQGQA
jgi:dihydroorotase